MGQSIHALARDATETQPTKQRAPRGAAKQMSCILSRLLRCATDQLRDGGWGEDGGAQPFSQKVFETTTTQSSEWEFARLSSPKKKKSWPGKVATLGSSQPRSRRSTTMAKGHRHLGQKESAVGDSGCSSEDPSSLGHSMSARSICHRSIETARLFSGKTPCKCADSCVSHDCADENSRVEKVLALPVVFDASLLQEQVDLRSCSWCVQHVLLWYVLN